MLLNKNQEEKDRYLHRVDLFNIALFTSKPYFDNRYKAS
jgi:hypothetical protein